MHMAGNVRVGAMACAVTNARRGAHLPSATERTVEEVFLLVAVKLAPPEGPALVAPRKALKASLTVPDCHEAHLHARAFADALELRL